MTVENSELPRNAKIPIGASIRTSPDVPYNMRAIRQLLTEALNDEDLTTFCFDHFPRVHDNFSMGLSRGMKIQMLLDYCKRQLQIERLLRLIKEDNYAQYEQYAERIYSRTPSPPDADAIPPTHVDRMEIHFGVDISEASPEQLAMVKGAMIGLLAHTLRIDPAHIHVVSTQKGSLIVNVVLPHEAADRLMALFHNDPLTRKDLGIERVVAHGHNLHGVDLQGAILSRVILNGADLSGADLRGAVLRSAILQGANLNGANLRGAILEAAILSEAILHSADLTGAILRNAILNKADLTEANLRGALLHAAIFSEARLDGAILEGTLLDKQNVPDASTEADDNASPPPPRGPLPPPPS